MKKILSFIFALMVIVAAPSCDKYLDCNDNVDAPDQVDAYLYLAGLLSAWQGTYWDIRATAPLAQMFGTSDYANYANHFYSKGSDAAGEMWRVTYWLQGVNLENMVNQAIENEEWTLAGIGYAIKAYSWDYTTKENVDMPCLQAFEPGRLSHDYDYQDVIYGKVREWAQEAIKYLEMDDPTDYGQKLKKTDLVYYGDKEKWLKFAHGVIVRNLASLSRKSNFTSDYADELIRHAALALTSNADVAGVERPGGLDEAQFTAYNNCWCPYRGYVDNYWPTDWAVQVMTGTVPKYDHTTGDRERSDYPIDAVGRDSINKIYYPFVLAENQIICDTVKSVPGHFDPRVTLKCGTTFDSKFNNIDNRDSVLRRQYIGSGLTSASGPIGTAPYVYGRIGVSNSTGDGEGRWLYRATAPYIIMAPAELKFAVAEAYWIKGDKASALEAWKEAVRLDVEFCGKYITPGKYDGSAYGSRPGGDKITTALYNELAAEYIAGPYVEGMTLDKFTLSHIMMQRWVSLFPWGANEAWVDLRKYHYDIPYNGEYPSFGNGWSETVIDHKWDEDATKVYKGFYLAPMQVEYRRGKYNIENEGSPCYRIRPRYNSEYMWNVPSLEKLEPISGTALNYQCSIPWFAYPNGYPKN